MPKYKKIIKWQKRRERKGCRCRRCCSDVEVACLARDDEVADQAAQNKSADSTGTCCLNIHVTEAHVGLKDGSFL
jgi:hypothetical protein